MSSMVIEFTRKEDLKQACYEATVDLNLYIAHLMSIAERCKKHFPEVATAISGAIVGIAQNLQGIDGEWQHGHMEKIRQIMTEPQFLDHMWVYELSRDSRGAVILLGCMLAIAAAKPGLTFWETLAMARIKMMDFEPLIEQLLKSSPQRTQ